MELANESKNLVVQYLLYYVPEDLTDEAEEDEEEHKDIEPVAELTQILHVVISKLHRTSEQTGASPSPPQFFIFYKTLHRGVRNAVSCQVRPVL